MNSRNPLLTFGTPRSGSSLFHSMIHHYLKQHQGLESLGEVFNLHYQNILEANNGIERQFYSDLLPLKSSDKIADIKALDFRFYLLSKYHRRYFFKVQAHHIWKREVSDWLLTEYEWIFVERRNLLEQVLSYLISMATHKWYTSGGIRPAESSLEFNPTALNDFTNTYFNYVKYKLWVRPKHVLIYDDFIRDGDVGGILNRLDLSAPVDLSTMVLPEKQNEGEKLRYFKNPKTILMAYKNTFLSELWPL